MSEYTQQQRAALVAWRLAHGEPLEDEAGLPWLLGFLDIQRDGNGVYFLAGQEPLAGPTTPQQRAALVALRLAQGQQLRGAEVARRLDVGYSAAYRILNRLAMVLPIDNRQPRKRWAACDFREED